MGSGNVERDLDWRPNARSSSSARKVTSWTPSVSTGPLTACRWSQSCKTTARLMWIPIKSSARVRLRPAEVDSTTLLQTYYYVLLIFRFNFQLQRNRLIAKLAHKLCKSLHPFGKVIQRRKTVAAPLVVRSARVKDLVP